MPDQVALATKLPVTLKPDHPLAAPIKRNRVLLRVLVVVGSLLAVLIAAIAVLHLYQQAAQHTRVNTQNLARSINQTIEEMVAVLDSSLQSTADELSHQIATGPIDPTAATAYMVKQLERTTNRIVAKPLLSDKVFSHVVTGLQESPYTEPRLLKYFQAATLPI